MNLIVTNNKLDYNTFSQLAKLIPKMRFERVSLRLHKIFIYFYNTYICNKLHCKQIESFSAKERTENQTACFVVKIYDIKRPALNGGRKYTVQFRNLCSKYFEKC